MFFVCQLSGVYNVVYIIFLLVLVPNYKFLCQIVQAKLNKWGLDVEKECQ